MKRLLLLTPALLLAACSGSPVPPPAASLPVTPTVSAVSSSVASEVPSQTVSLVSQSFDKVTSGGITGLSEMGVKKIKGHLDKASLTLDLQGSGKWGVVAMYFAPLLPAKLDAKGNVTFREGINIDQEWKRFRFIGATWNGQCKRLVSPKSFGSVGTVPANMTFDLSALPLTKGEDGCDNTQDIVNVVDMINANGGGYIGFLTSPPSYTLKADLVYTGNIEVTPLTSK